MINWRNIRPLDGSQDKGFEELCAQLARAERPSGSQFIRKGAPDAGVECFAVLADGSEWGWQAKYFDGLGDSQWQQIDKSINTALDKHPRLARYYVCVPYDRPDARIDGRKSALDRWNDHVAAWEALATGRGMRVEFVYWGGHELITLLADPQRVGLLMFWFDVRRFDRAWFTARIDESRHTAGPRYTPELHVGLPIAESFDAFGRTDRFFDRQKSHAHAIRRTLSSFESEIPASVEGDVRTAAASLSSRVKAVLTALRDLSPRPSGPLPFVGIVELIRAAESESAGLGDVLVQRAEAVDAEQAAAIADPHERRMSRNLFRDIRGLLYALVAKLNSAREYLTEAERVAGSSLLLLRGAAGTGKTHLLCDVAVRRNAAGLPTVLLMGQRFISSSAPWPQALEQLDLAGCSAEAFVGALEAAAQAAGSRALVMIDAVNEGAGRAIWPSHMAAFMAHLGRSEWIGTVISVRSSFEGMVIPDAVRGCAAAVTHMGFADHEFDAAQTFFRHYGLELPSTPILTPEFSNPLFLKTLCRGLQARGDRRLPRGFHGITLTFGLFLDAVEASLAVAIGYNPKRRLAQKALESIVQRMIESREPWLESAEAEDLLIPLLPGREFDRSLYRSLLGEGLLGEEPRVDADEPGETIVVLAYERFADYQSAKFLLDRHLDAGDPARAFGPGAPLAFVSDAQEPLSPGLLEALCVQVPERTGRELASIAPECADRWGFGDAFRQSLIWRSTSAFSEETRLVLNSLSQSERDEDDTLDALLTVSSLPGHPLNALFLDGRLRRDGMPDRDAWWSTYLYRSWGNGGAIDRLVHWASAVASSDAIDDEACELCAIVLAWSFTTSNRFLRDRATQALACLLAGRISVAVRVVERMADVDDPYVLERLYAVAYGVAMRSCDPVQIGRLATCVYGLVFKSGNPLTHILLRDYARGVIERALHLGATVDASPGMFRPPYRSPWPVIPSEEDLKSFLADGTTGSHASGDVAWSRNTIRASVMSGDFAWYVIGTNSSTTSNDWQAITLREPAWEPPPDSARMLESLVAEFTDAERTAWEAVDDADTTWKESYQALIAAVLEREDGSDGAPRRDLEALHQQVIAAETPEHAEVAKRREEAWVALNRVLSPEHARRLAEIRESEEIPHTSRRPPGFDLRQVQRYVLGRVFSLGWTVERFGYFDRNVVVGNGRSATKAERMGKKYQWIAFHEIQAHLSDHYRFGDRLFGESTGTYEGPWQLHLRDIDPSCPLRALPQHGEGDNGALAWWSASYPSLLSDESPRDWVLKTADLPSIEDLLIVTDPRDGSRWVNGYGFFDWNERVAGQDHEDSERRNAWYICTGYLIREDDAPAFLAWANGVDFYGRWMPEPGEVYRMFVGEHSWSPAFRHFHQPYYGEDGWTQPKNGCPVKVRTAALEYLREASGFDCSVEEGYTLRLPVAEIVNGMGLRWSGHAADFLDDRGRIAVQDPSAKIPGPSSLLLREELLLAYLSREKLTLCWAILGEKRVFPAGFGGRHRHPMINVSAGYALVDGRIQGSTKFKCEHPP